jgi:flagellar assembly protein FliH
VTGRARVLRGERAAGARPLFAAGAGEPTRKRILREELEAHDRGARLLEAAEAKALEIVARARAEGVRAAGDQAREAGEQARTEAVAQWLAVRQTEQERLERATDRLATIACAMAERILGASLGLHPQHIVELARGVMAEARGVRRAVVDAHPEDAVALAASVAGGGFEIAALEVREDSSLARGELRLHTDLGKIEARLAPRFERLAAAVRSALSEP